MAQKPSYRAGVETPLHGSGLPYGYTISVWGSGQLLIDRLGAPGTSEVGLFAAGAVVAWGTLRVLSRGASEESGLQLAVSPHFARAGVVHVAAIGLALAAAAVLGTVVDAGAAWPLGSFAATLVYLGTTAAELTLREGERAAEDDG